MPEADMDPLHGFLAGVGRDSRGRSVTEVLAFSDEQLEAVHDYIQWLFPLPTRSAAQPAAPVLTESEIMAIRVDPAAIHTLAQATERMLKFYGNTRWWLAWQDHNHLRITRIIHSSSPLPQRDSRHECIGRSADNPRSLQFWSEAAGE